MQSKSSLSIWAPRAWHSADILSGAAHNGKMDNLITACTAGRSEIPQAAVLHCCQAAADLKEGQLVVAAGHISAWPRLKDGEGSPTHRGCCAAARQHRADVHN